MPITLSLYENLLQALEYAEMDGNFKALRSGIEACSTMAGPGAGQPFSVGALTASRLIASGSGPAATALPNTYSDGVEWYNISVDATWPAQYGLVRSEKIGAGRFVQTFYEQSAAAPSRYRIDNGDNTWSVWIKIITANVSGNIEIPGSIIFTADNTYNLGSASYRAAVIYAGTGTINTSDAREKTTVTPLTSAEIAAAKDLAKEVGTYQFLAAVANKGNQARHHVGMTVQRAIEIMTSHGLDPFAYGFICYDQWEDKFIDHSAIEAVAAQAAQPAEYVTAIIEEQVIVNGEETTIQRSKLVCVKEAVPAVEAVEAKPAWREQIQAAGDRYSFRPDELLLFIARGFEARLTALEGN